MENIKYLKLLSKNFKNIAETATEIINLEAILNLPKGTEHFLSDIHGEYEAFNHILRNGSGTIKQKIMEIYKNRLSQNEINELATLIYYPQSKYDVIEKQQENIEEWTKITIYRLIEICKHISVQYTRSKVRKLTPKDFEYIIQELLYEKKEVSDKKEYVETIIDTIISIKYSRDFIRAISKLIRRLIIDKLHIVGDIFDRGTAPHLVMDCLIDYHNVDIQWGNHDLLWLGAGIGNKPCVANVVRICARYNNISILEDGYGINLSPLITFAIKYYSDDNCEKFKVKTDMDNDLIAKIHKAITIIQFKIEGQISEKNPKFGLTDKENLKKINFEEGTVEIDGTKYLLNDTNFPTINVKKPFELNEDEKIVLDKLRDSFKNNEKLRRHLTFLVNKGSMYLKCNSNLLYHGCVPLEKDGSLTKIEIDGKFYSGKSYFDKIETIVRQEFFNREKMQEDNKNADFFWYLWCGRNSPLFGKDVMRTFERYFIDDKKIHKENKNPYYEYVDNEKVCEMILIEFGLDEKNSHIVNGHVPVKARNGETPIKANGKLLMIDGGFAKSYQKTTGIAGYTMIDSCNGTKLISLVPFESKEKAIMEEIDIQSSEIVFVEKKEIVKVKDTDIGKEIQVQIEELKNLLEAYREGLIKQI